MKAKKRKETKDRSPIKTWEDKINRARKFREDEWNKPFRVAVAREYFAGRQNPGYPEAEWITVNKIYSHLMAQLPTLYSVDPYFYVKIKRSFSPHAQEIALFEQKAKIRQAYLNYLKGETKLKIKARLAIQDAFFAYGVLKVHYSSDQIENPDAGKPLGQGLLDQLGGALLEPDTIPINERYLISRVHPDDFFWSEDAGPLEDKWHWIAERIRMTKEEAESDSRLNQSVLKSVQQGEETDKDKSGSSKKKEDEPYILWEVYDLDRKEWFIFSPGSEDFLKGPSPLPKGVETHPYAVLRYTLQDKTPYPIPPVSQMLDPQKELCLARSRMLTHRKRFNRKYEAFVSGLVDETELDKLEVGDDGTIIRKQTQGPVITPIQDAPMDQQGWMEISHLNNDLIEISGYGGEARGLADADSATQADIIEKRLNIREGDRLSLVTDFILEVAEKLDKLVQVNISRDEAVRISGPQGEYWEIIRTDDYQDIAGEFEYSVNLGATFPQLPHIERSQWLAFLNLLAGFPHLLMQKHLMKRMAEMHHIEDENMLEELYQLGKQIMSGSAPMPGQKGSTPGSGELPGTAAAGSALGFLGGLINGGGSTARDGTG